MRVGLAAAGLLALVLQTRPVSFWEYDELLFAAGVVRFDPLQHHPHPPGYPVYIGLGKLAALLTGSPFAALVAVSSVLTVVGFVAAAAAFRNLLRDDWLGLSAALLFSLSAGMLVDASLPLSDAPAVALMALAVHRASRQGAWPAREAVLLGVFASLAVGCRPQLAVMVLPLLAGVVLQSQSRGRTAALVAASFTAASLAWLLPLLTAAGGMSGLLRYEVGQAYDFAAHDAELARSGWRPVALVLRFVAHPWGPKALSVPVLASAAIGLGAAAKGRERWLAPLVASGGLYLAFAIAAMDPGDGVRYALPSTFVVALLAARGLGAVARRAGPAGLRIVPLGVAAIAAGSLRYVAPVVVARHASPSPPVQAAEYARDRLPADAVILFDRSLRPHAQQLFPSFRTAQLGEGFGGLADRGEVPVFILADGASDEPGAVSFSWADSDAYSKLTRNHYRVVSLIPVPQTRRYRAVRGVYEPERTAGGKTWRWLAPAAEIALPDLDATVVQVRLALPRDYPWESVQVRLRAPPSATVGASVKRGETVRVNIRLPKGRQTIRIHTARAYVPAEVPSLLQRDRRVLGVMLVDVEQRLIH